MRTPPFYSGRWMAQQLIKEIQAWIDVMDTRPEECQSGVIILGEPDFWSSWIKGVEDQVPPEDKGVFEALKAKQQEYNEKRAVFPNRPNVGPYQRGPQC